MAHVLASLDPDSSPLPQEARAFVYMTFAPAPSEQELASIPAHAPRGPGYRISVTAAETGRTIGRWVSDCPLSIVQGALLWLSMSPWQVEPAEGSLDYLAFLNDVPRGAPNPEGALPRQVFDLLGGNFPRRGAACRAGEHGRAPLEHVTLARAGL